MKDDYLQPSFYRFNQDSLDLVNHVCSKVVKCSSLLDLGAGCGVLGVEISRRLNIEKTTYLELQKDFLEYLSHNVSKFSLPDNKSNIVHASFSSWRPLNKFEVIVSNPPYFFPDSGQRCSDLRRDLARAFLVDTWQDFFECIENGLSPNGSAYIVLKRDKVLINRVLSFIDKKKFNTLLTEKTSVFLIELSRLNI